MWAYEQQDEVKPDPSGCRQQHFSLVCALLLMSLWSNNELIGADNMFVLQASAASLIFLRRRRRRKRAVLISPADVPRFEFNNKISKNFTWDETETSVQTTASLKHFKNYYKP